MVVGATASYSLDLSFPQLRPPPRLVLEVDRRRHVDEGQADEFREPPGLLLERAGADDVTSPRHRLFDRAEHDRDVRPQTDRVGDPMALEPLVGRDLVRTEN